MSLSIGIFTGAEWYACESSILLLDSILVRFPFINFHNMIEPK